MDSSTVKATFTGHLTEGWQRVVGDCIINAVRVSSHLKTATPGDKHAICTPVQHHVSSYLWLVQSLFNITFKCLQTHLWTNSEIFLFISFLYLQKPLLNAVLLKPQSYSLWWSISRQVSVVSEIFTYWFQKTSRAEEILGTKFLNPPSCLEHAPLLALPLVPSSVVTAPAS